MIGTQLSHEERATRHQSIRTALRNEIFLGAAMAGVPLALLLGGGLAFATQRLDLAIAGSLAGSAATALIGWRGTRDARQSLDTALAAVQEGRTDLTPRLRSAVVEMEKVVVTDPAEAAGLWLETYAADDRHEPADEEVDP